MQNVVTASLTVFRALPVGTQVKNFVSDWLSEGALVNAEVEREYSSDVIEYAIKKLFPSKKIYNTFHKSWAKISESSDEELVAAQLLHYFSTYGLRGLGIESDDLIWTPDEDFEIPELRGTPLLIVKGITPNHMMRGIERILSSGIALSTDVVSAIGELITYYDLKVDISACKNKELRCSLYEAAKIVPSYPEEYLRLVVYRATGKALLIKNKEVIEEIRSAKLNLSEYTEKYGVSNLASIFYRYKPLFLAMKNGEGNSTIVNRIRKLAPKYHSPMPKDIIGSVTSDLRHGTFDSALLEKALENANIFRKVRLLQALRFYQNDIEGIVYKVRNGKTYTTTSSPVDTTPAIEAVESSIAKSLSHLSGKSVFADTNYAFPVSGKQFMGSVPYGSSYSTTESIVVGITWENGQSSYVDLDLSVLSLSGKIGWDSRYKTSDFFFSGDITSAPNGASEAFLVRKNCDDGIYLFYVNLYSSECDVAPFTVFVTTESANAEADRKSMFSRENMVFHGDTEVTSTERQRLVGVLRVQKGVKTFYMFSGVVERGITSRNDERNAQAIDYFHNYLDSIVTLKDILPSVGAGLVNNPKEADYDLSINAITPSTLVELVTKEEE